MVRNLRSVTLILAVLAFSFTLQPATAQTVDECQAQITQLQADTMGATFRNTRDQTALVAKLDDASAKLDAGKYGDAVQKLSDFRDKIVSLNSQGKINTDDAGNLLDGANAAIDCVASLR